MDQIIQNLGIALTSLTSIIDWVFVLVFFLTAYMAVRILADSNVAKKVKVKLAKKWIVLLSAAFLAIAFGLFYWQGDGFPWYTPGTVAYSLSLFFSTLMAIFLNEFFGIDKIIDKLFNVQINKPE